MNQRSAKWQTRARPEDQVLEALGAQPERPGSDLENNRIKAVSQLLWPDKDREEWFSLGEKHEKVRGSPGFPARGTHRGQ